jgi:hypothetical protein
MIFELKQQPNIDTFENRFSFHISSGDTEEFITLPKMTPETAHYMKTCLVPVLEYLFSVVDFKK